MKSVVAQFVTLPLHVACLPDHTLYASVPSPAPYGHVCRSCDTSSHNVIGVNALHAHAVVHSDSVFMLVVKLTLVLLMQADATVWQSAK